MVEAVLVETGEILEVFSDFYAASEWEDQWEERYIDNGEAPARVVMLEFRLRH